MRQIKITTTNVLSREVLMKLFWSSIVLALSFSASAITPSPTQLEQFKKLPKAQQEALAKQYGISLDSLIPKQSPSSSLDKEREFSTPSEKMDNEGVTIDQNHGIVDTSELRDEISTEGDEKTLKLFGYDIFAGQSSGFEPLTNVPVPAEYVLGPGDEINVKMFGKEYQSVSVTIDRNGTFSLPETGPISVAGLSFSEFKDVFQQELSNKVIGLKATVTMGALRSMRIFVLGEVNRPGAYTVSSLSTMTHALFSAGGITGVGSLRNVELKRRGKLITKLDLYDMLLKGDTANDVNLLAGDVVFVPPTGKIVGVEGEVKRPALYEMKGGESVLDVLNLAGGELPTAYLKVSKLERINDVGAKTVLDMDLTSFSHKNTKIKNGDILRIKNVLNELQNVVRLEGHALRTGVFSWKEGQRALDIIGTVSELKTNPDLDYALIIREEPNIKTISALQFSLKEALNDPQTEKNPRLKPLDTVYIFSSEEKRNIDDVLSRLEKQARSSEPAKLVEVVGNVEYPGMYPLTKGMTIGSLIRASFDVKEYTDRDYALLKRVNFAKNKVEFEVISLKEPSSVAYNLQELDKLYVFNLNEPREKLIADLLGEIRNQTSKENEQSLVTINGQVRFPGTYPLSSNMSAADLVAAAGGYTESSYLVDFNVARFVTNGIDESTYDLQTIELNENTLETFSLEAKDSLFIKGIPEWQEAEVVELVGEFKFPGKYAIRKGESLAQLVERAGGFNNYAEIKASIFTREYLRVKEQRVLDEAHEKMKQQMVLGRYNAGQFSDGSAGSFQSILNTLEQAEAVGRMVVTSDQITNVKSSLELRDGDRLIVPRKTYEVSVLGQVYQPTTLPWISGQGIDDYIEGAGGVNQIAEEGDTYLIKANGRVVTGGWFESAKVEPGDSIMVPADISPIPTLTLWQAVTTILAQSATTIALIAAL